MKTYEGMFIFKSDLNKEALDKVSSQVQEVIQKHKGSIEKKDEWGKKQLSYPIKKYKEGFYYLITFHIGPEAITDLKRYFILNESILRVLITVKR